MNMRKLTSLTAGLSFVFVVLTSVILYIVPQGRVAYWADWHLWGLDKEEWGAVHINIGLLFLISLFLHIYLNWKPLMAYLKDRSRRIKIFTAPFNLALLLCVATVAGTLFMVPPFSWVLDLNTTFKDAGSRKYGEPPYGHAELSTLTSFAKKVDIDAQAAIKQLQDAGFQVRDGKQTLKDLAILNHTTPKAIFDAMRKGDARSQSSGQTMPDSPPPGTGRLTIAELGDTYHLDVTLLLKALESNNIGADPLEPLRDIAERHGVDPRELYETIRLAALSIGQSKQQP